MKKVCVFTGTRAEYGLLSPLMRLLDHDADFQLQLLVSGTHLSSEHGMTCRVIEEDGFSIDEKIDIMSDDDSAAGVCESMGRGVSGYGAALGRLNPDLFVILGDRFEALAAASAAAVCGVPVVHLHGGETTLGAMDEVFRHAITKLSSLHFAATDQYRRRIIQMGESPDRVFNVGALGLENVSRLELMPQADLEKDIGFVMGDSCLLVTFHPATMDTLPAREQMQVFLDALGGLDDVKVLFTKANADAGGREINNMIDEYAASHPEHAAAYTSLGLLRYLSAMSHAAAVVGNSSSGIIEAPGMGTPTVNIGSRQEGRVRADSIIDCGLDVNAIRGAVKKAVSPEFQASAKDVVSPYYQENTAQKMVQLIKDFNPDKGLCKTFHDIPEDVTIS